MLPKNINAKEPRSIHASSRSLGEHTKSEKSGGIFLKIFAYPNSRKTGRSRFCKLTLDVPFNFPCYINLKKRRPKTKAFARKSQMEVAKVPQLVALITNPLECARRCSLAERSSRSTYWQFEQAPEFELSKRQKSVEK